MALNISTNTAAHRAGAQLSVNQSRLQRSFDRIASGKRISTPVEDPGSLAVSMKLQAAINRLSGAQNNVKNAISFLEVQDGLLDAVGKIVDRMSELKGLATQDPMKSEQDRASYNNEFKDLQVQLFDISQMKFNGVSIFANHTTNDKGENTSEAAVFGAQNQSQAKDNTITIFTSADGQSGSKVSLHKSLLLSSLTLGTDKTISKEHSDGVTGNLSASPNTITFASESVSGTLSLGQISVGVIAQALENIAFLRAQNGGTHSRLAFNSESLVAQKTNMRAALGRMVDVDMAEETTNLAKYSFLSQAAASVLSQANSNTDIALMLLR
ncbi:flagellin [Opitutales bacterium]|jgi:flagellin|nr:flagellin [Opitutales bacterium]